MSPKSRVRNDFYEFINNNCYFKPLQKPLSLAVLPLDTTNDIFFNEKHERITGKYRVVTKAFTGGSPKFEAVQVQGWKSRLNRARITIRFLARFSTLFKSTGTMSSTGLKPTVLMLNNLDWPYKLPQRRVSLSICQFNVDQFLWSLCISELKRNSTKKRTHLSSQETVVSNTVKMYFKFQFM